MSYEQTNQDLLYIEDGYLTPDGYYVYIALAQVAIGPYIEDLYIDAGYYEDYSAVISLTCAADVISGQVVEASGTWTAAFTQSATVIRIQNAESTQTAAFTQTSSVGRILQASAAFTGAFSPTLTADAFKNHTAILNVLASIVTTPVVNRAANITLATIGNLNSQAVKTVDIVFTQTTATTQTTNGVKSTDITQNLSSTSTVSVDAFNVQFGQAAFSTTATIFASRNFGTGRPRSFTTTGTTSFTTNRKFGSHALLCNSGGSNNVQASATPDYNRWRTIDLWYYTTAPGGGGGFRLLSTSRWTLRVDNPSPPGLYTIVFNRPAGGNAETNNLTATGWVHLRLIREDSGSYYTLYINGAKQTWATNTFTTSALTATNETLVIGNTATINQHDSIIDELLITNNLLNTSASSTITVPTAAWTFDSQTNVLILSHFNNVNDDDVSINQIGAAALTSTASLTAQANANTKQGAGAFAATATVTASVTRIKQFTSSLNSVFTVPDVKAKHQANGIASLEQAIFTQTTEGQRVRYFDITVSSLFTPTMTVNAQRAGVALLESNFVQLTQAHKTTDIVSAQNVVSTQSVTARFIAGLAADLASTAIVTVTGTRTQLATADLASESTLVCEFTAFNNVSAAFTSEVTITADVERYRSTSSTLSTAVTLSADVERYRSTSSTLSTTSTVTATATRIQSADSALSSVVTQSTVAVKTPGIGVSIAANVTFTASPIYTAAAIATVGALFTPVMDADAQFAGVALLESVSTVTVIIGVIKQFEPKVNTGLQLPISVPNIGTFDAVIYPNDIQEQGYQLGSIAVPGPWAYDAATLSIWVKRNTNSSGGTLITSREYSVPRDIGQIVIDGNTIRLGDFGFSGLINVNWINAMPPDTDWHHLFFKYTTQAGFYGDGYSLWVDGVSKGYRELQSNDAGIITFIAEYGCSIGGNVAVAQLRVGDATITVNDIYDYDRGYRDLGVTGRGYFNELTAPGIYATFDQPWSNIVVGQGNDTYVEYYQASSAPIPIPDLQAHCRLTASFIGVFLHQANLNSQFAVSIPGQALRDADASINAACSINLATGGGVFGGNCAVSVEHSLSCTVSKTTGYESALISTVTVFARGGYELELIADLSSTVTLECDFDNIPPTRGEAALLSQFTVTVDVQSFTDSITLMVSFGTLNCAVTVIPPIRTSANLSSAFTVTATVGAIEQFAVLTASAGTMTIAASKRVGVVASITALATETVTANKFHGIGLTVLQAQGFQLTVGDIINIDPYLTLIIPTETRQLRILPENRVITIASESRLLYINKRTQV